MGGEVRTPECGFHRSGGVLPVSACRCRSTDERQLIARRDLDRQAVAYESTHLPVALRDVHVDFEDQTRTLKDSALWYAGVTARNALHDQPPAG